MGLSTSYTQFLRQMQVYSVLLQNVSIRAWRVFLWDDWPSTVCYCKCCGFQVLDLGEAYFLWYNPQLLLVFLVVVTSEMRANGPDSFLSTGSFQSHRLFLPTGVTYPGFPSEISLFDTCTLWQSRLGWGSGGGGKLEPNLN